MFVPDGADDQPDRRLERLLADPPAPSQRAAFDYCSLGVAFDRRADYDKSGQCASLALGILESLHCQEDSWPETLILFRSLSLLGTALRQQGAYEKAENPLIRAVELGESLPDRPELAPEAWNNLGVLCKYAGWFDLGAEAQDRKSVV